MQGRGRGKPLPRGISGKEGLIGRWAALNHRSPEGWWDFIADPHSLTQPSMFFLFLLMFPPLFSCLLFLSLLLLGCFLEADSYYTTIFYH